VNPPILLNNLMIGHLRHVTERANDKDPASSINLEILLPPEFRETRRQGNEEEKKEVPPGSKDGPLMLSPVTKDSGLVTPQGLISL